MPNDANNRLTRWGGKTYSYDPNGNLLADGTHSYQWNERNQLTGLSAGATSLASFSYDSLGRRSAKTVAGATTGFVYDGDTFVQELLGASSNSAVKAQLLTGGIDETLLRIEGTSRHSVLADGNTQQYTGRENDNPGNAGGLYCYRARYYMPGCARFISEDPIGWASGQTNNYAYVGGNPISWVDPNGLMGRGSGGSGMQNVYAPGQGPGQSIGDFASGLGNAYYNMMSRIDRSLSSIGSGSSPAGTGQCVTAECAAGLLPAPSDNRTQAQIDVGLCTLVCNISAAGPIAACNAAAGGGLVGGVAATAGRMSVCSMVCKP